MSKIYAPLSVKFQASKCVSVKQMTNIRYVVAISPLSPMSSASPPPGSPQSGRPKVLGWSPCRRRKASLTRRRSAETLAEPGRDHQQHEHHHKHHQHHHHLIVIISIILTRPRPAFGRLGLGRSLGGYTYHGYTSHTSPRACGARLGQKVQELLEICKNSNVLTFEPFLKASQNGRNDKTP